jgi:hypothetical protein
MASPDLAFEQHFTIRELAALWHCGRESLRLIFSREPDVIKIRMGGKQKNNHYLIPASVAARVHLRLTSGR